MFVLFWASKVAVGPCFFYVNLRQTDGVVSFGVEIHCVLGLSYPEIVMDQLEESQQQELRKTNTERLRARLMRKAGLDEETVFSLDRPMLLEELAKVMLAEAEAAEHPAEGGALTEITEFQLRLMELEERQRVRELEQIKLEFEQKEREKQRELELIKLQHEKEIEQTKLEQQKFMCEQNIAVQRDIALAQQKQREQEAIAREQRQTVLDQREESLVNRTKRYGQAVQYALTAMPNEAGDLPSWFNMVENVWGKFEVPDDLKSKLLIPKLTSHAKTLITRLTLDEQDKYETLREFLLKQYQLGSREYRARFIHAGRKSGETWVSYTSRLKNLFLYYTKSCEVATFDSLFDLCIYDKLSDSLPMSTLRHCLGVIKDQKLKSSDFAEIADNYEANFFPDGRYKGLAVTADGVPPQYNRPRGPGPGGGPGLVGGLRPGGVHGTYPNNSASYNTARNSTSSNSTFSNGPGNGNRPMFHSKSHGGLVSPGAGSLPRPRMSPPVQNSNAHPVRCWTCGEFGHLASAHKNNNSGSVKHNKPQFQEQTSVNAIDKSDTSVKTVNHCCVMGRDADEEFVSSSSIPVVPEHFPKVRNRVDVDDEYDLDQSFLTNLFEVEQTSCEVSAEPVVASSDTESSLSTTSSLSFVMLDVDNSPRDYKAMIDSGTVIAVAKSSLVPEECREYVGKTRLQGAFGECVDADLVTLKVRLKCDKHTVASVMSIPIVFALTDALASKQCDMLLPMHAVMELRKYQDVCVVCPEGNSNLNIQPRDGVCDVLTTGDAVNTGGAPVSVKTGRTGDKGVVGDSDSVENDDDLCQDRDVDFDNIEDLTVKVVNESNLQQFAKEQREDMSLRQFWDMAEKKKGGMFVRNELLYHQDNVAGMRVEQLAVPEGRRQELIRLAHCTGHMRAQKTRERLRLNFFFPGMRKMVFSILSRCRECQLRAKQKASDNVPIVPIVRPTLPFMVAHADLIGPLDPPSSQGHTHALCIVDACTRWPSVFLLRATNSKAICDCFVDLFQHTGMYETIVMDNGTNLCSKLTTEFMTRLGVSPRFITPYHCQANGLVERFNQSFKSMLHFAMREHGRAWHKAVPFLVWSMREVPNATTGVSPFVLQYGVQPKGVLSLVKDNWTGMENLPTIKPVAQYLTELKSHLETTREFASHHAQKAQEQYAKYYNAHAQNKTFQVGEEVIVLEKDSNAKTYSRWHTGEVLRVLSPFSYIVGMPNGSRRHLHANRMRKLITDVYHIGIVREQDSDFGEISSVPNDNTDSLPSKHVADIEHLNPDQQARLKNLLDEFGGCFSSQPGLCTIIHHEINTTKDFVPRRTRAYRVPEVLKIEIEHQIDELLRQDFIEPSDSPMTSGVVCVTKPDKSVRICCDYRYLNKYTIPDATPMPILIDCVHKVSRANYISICDAKSGFWQLLIKPEHRWKAAFVTHHGVWQWKRMPFGLRNAPGTFVRLMRNILHPIRDSSESYIDDSYTFSSNFDLHCEHLRRFLTVVRDSGLTLNLSKCHFAQTQVPFVGYVVGGGHFYPDPSKVEAIMSMKEPRTKTEVRRVLGVLSFYRNHVEGFARIAKPLTDLTSNKAPSHFQLSVEAREAFRELQSKVCSAPVLVSPRFGEPFCLYTDASQFAVGCCLAQADKSGVEFPIAYGSQRLTPAQVPWSTVEKEAYAVIWAIGRFRTIIFGAPITVYSDHNPLRFLTECAPKSARLTRWALALQDYLIDVKYKKGSANTLADGLSRI